jgi:hypothetical protein
MSHPPATIGKKPSIVHGPGTASTLATTPSAVASIGPSSIAVATTSGLTYLQHITSHTMAYHDMT